MENSKEIIGSTLNKIQKIKPGKHLLIGFDGFVDEIIHVVDKRKDENNFDRISDITAFSERVAQGAGLSANVELVPTQIKLGGNGPIMANAMNAQGYDITYIGALGKYYIHPVFREFAEKCKKIVSLTDPGFTEALEFFDGKVMLGKMNNLIEVNFENLLTKMSMEDIEALLEEVELIAFQNWTMLSRLNSIITEFNNIISKLPKKPLAFFDLADPKKRTHDDIRLILKNISEMKTSTILGMNLSESTIISLVLGIKEDDLITRATLIREELGITGVVIHPINGAAIAHEKGNVWVEGPYTPTPKLTTGAGDNFNAGFCNGWLNGMSPAECLTMGVCSSGFYVRNGYSPSLPELIEFMKHWQKGQLKDE